MAERGAKHILVLSRRSLEPVEHENMAHKFRLIAEDCQIYFKSCDVAVKSQLQDVASSIASMGIPPIKGVIQATAVL